MSRLTNPAKPLAMQHLPRSFDVVALGEAMVEFNQTQPGQPQ